MSVEELSRSNIQALWNYMPGQPFNWSRKASVIGASPRQVSVLDLPEGWVAAPLRRLIRPFAEASSGVPGGGPELDVIERGQFELVKAEDLRAQRFPNTFHCDQCGLFKTVTVGEPAPSCARHGQMEQFSWVDVHECGHIGQLAPPRCANNCKAPMGLFNTRSFNISRWYWRCTKCNTRSDIPVTRYCPQCRSGRVSVTRVPQTSAYYPQHVTVINPPTRTSYAALAHDQVHAAAVAQALGMLPPGLDGLQAATAKGSDPIAQVEAMAATLGIKPGDPMYDALLAKAAATVGKAPDWRSGVDALGLDEETLDALGEECRQLSLARGATALTVEDLLRNSVGGPLHAQYQTYRPLFGSYGLADVTLLRQLPVAYVIAGYTRVLARATAVNRRGTQVTAKFRFFQPGKSAKFPMYGVRTETEGLLFRLDAVKVVHWLVDSGVVADPGVSTPEDAQRWLFTVAEPVTDVFSAPENRISEAVLGLTHSFAHRAMKALAARSGLNVDSLAEFLFPSNCAFLLYANTRSEFILGGLEHVFRFDLPDALAELDAESRCVFDPPCRHAFGGSCAACLYVSEVACARFNTVLDRNLLFGSLPPVSGVTSPGEIQWRAFWTP